MVFEVSYLDPGTAFSSFSTDSQPPVISDIDVSLPGTTFQGQIAAPQQVKISTRVVDNGTNGLDVGATYTIDGLHWQRKTLTLNQATGLFEATVPAPSFAENIFVIVEARDQAGNVAVDTAKGTFSSYAFNYLPLLLR